MRGEIRHDEANAMSQPARPGVREKPGIRGSAKSNSSPTEDHDSIHSENFCQHSTHRWNFSTSLSQLPSCFSFGGENANAPYWVNSRLHLSHFGLIIGLSPDVALSDATHRVRPTFRVGGWVQRIRSAQWLGDLIGDRCHFRSLRK